MGGGYSRDPTTSTTEGGEACVAACQLPAKPLPYIGFGVLDERTCVAARQVSFLAIVTLCLISNVIARPLGGGYRDINVLLRVVHHVCELQFNLQKMIDVKESAAGHGSYERIRLFNDKVIVAALLSS